ncbi:MAG TPA: hypothetical protein VGG56_09850 [Terracidiphilus sp.]|jgi:hypothetical protein
MEPRNDGMRERLLARLPQPENVVAYREQTELLLAKHERALYWEKVTGTTVTWFGIALFMLANNHTWGLKLDTHTIAFFDVLAIVLFFTGALNLLGYWISRNKVDILKEVKQVQLQVLELQASLRKDDDR